jgi:tetratricopeptide (TPR) repeat protein
MPTDPKTEVLALYRKAAQSYREGRYKRALIEARRALEINPQAYFCIALEARALGKLGDSSAYLEGILRAIEIFSRVEPSSASVEDINWWTAFLYHYLGNAHYHVAKRTRDSQEWRDALLAYQKVLSVSPSDARAWYAYGLVKWRLGYKLDSIKHFRRAIECDPDFAEAHRSLLACETRLLHFESSVREARAIFKLLVEKYPTVFEAGEKAWKNKNYDAVVKAYAHNEGLLNKTEIKRLKIARDFLTEDLSPS